MAPKPDIALSSARGINTGVGPRPNLGGKKLASFEGRLTDNGGVIVNLRYKNLNRRGQEDFAAPSPSEEHSFTDLPSAIAFITKSVPGGAAPEAEAEADPMADMGAEAGADPNAEPDDDDMGGEPDDDMDDADDEEM